MWIAIYCVAMWVITGVVCWAVSPIEDDYRRHFCQWLFFGAPILLPLYLLACLATIVVALGFRIVFRDRLGLECLIGELVEFWTALTSRKRV